MSMPPPSSTPPLPSTGEPDAAAASHSTAETDSVIEPQSVSEIQPSDETHSIVEPPPLVATTLTTGMQSTTVVTLSIAAPTQTTETRPIVTQPSTTVTSTIVVSSETADLRVRLSRRCSLIRHPRALYRCLLLRQLLLLHPLRHVGSRLHTARRRERGSAQRWHPQRPRKMTLDNRCAARQYCDLRRRYA